MENRPVPLLVIGAGPAGCAAARLLAAWGHEVLVVGRPARDVARRAESIPPSAEKLLATIGALPAIEDAGFVRWRGNTVWWAGEAPRVEAFAPGTAGYQVDRRSFDELLRRLAIESGADVRAGLVRDVVVAGVTGERDTVSESDAPVEASVDFDGPLSRIRAGVVIDCSGRAGVLARRGLRLPTSGPHTIALGGIWQAPSGWGLDDDSHTLVASYGDGWAWSVPTGPGIRHFTVMVDPLRTDLTRRVSSRDVYLAELAKAEPLKDILNRGTLAEGPWGADATPYRSSRYAGHGFLLAGDAGSAIDPLSSFGVKKALASGWLAAIVANTCLSNPAMRGAALEFFERRERDAFAEAQREAARFADDINSRNAHPFWTVRAEAAFEPRGDGAMDVSAFARDPEVLAAFDDLRTRSAVRLVRSPAVRLCQRPVIRGREIVLDDHLVLPDCPDGVRYLRGVDLVGLLDLAPAHGDVGDLYRAYSDRHPRENLPDFLGALSVLIARRQLVNGDVA